MTLQEPNEPMNVRDEPVEQPNNTRPRRSNAESPYLARNRIAEREAIAQQTEAFLKRGASITIIPKRTTEQVREAYMKRSAFIMPGGYDTAR